MREMSKPGDDSIFTRSKTSQRTMSILAVGRYGKPPTERRNINQAINCIHARISISIAQQLGLGIRWTRVISRILKLGGY